jgi:hypothetical protein
VRPAAVVWLSGTASAALVGAYLALGGASFKPAPVADPCHPRPWRNPHGTAALAEQIALSALDGAACKLHVSREALVLAFESRATLEQFGRDHHLPQATIESAARDGLRRAISDAEHVHAIGSLESAVLRGVVGVLPLDAIVRALQGSSLNW